jgi:hypothetical protein
MARISWPAKGIGRLHSDLHTKSNHARTKSYSFNRMTAYRALCVSPELFHSDSKQQTLEIYTLNRSRQHLKLFPPKKERHMPDAVARWCSKRYMRQNVQRHALLWYRKTKRKVVEKRRKWQSNHLIPPEALQYRKQIREAPLRNRL